MAKKLQWKVDLFTAERKSTCGRYVVWLNGHTRWGNSWQPEWAAALTSAPPGDWLASCEGTCKEAKNVCQKHADKESTS